jgi:hypothetical protein
MRDGRLQPGGFNEIRQTIDVETDEIRIAGPSEAFEWESRKLGRDHAGTGRVGQHPVRHHFGGIRQFFRFAPH